MNEQLKTDWVKALRSNKYKQVEGALKTDSGFDAIGLLLEISGIGSWEKDEVGWFFYDGIKDYLPARRVMNSRLRQKVGLSLVEADLIMDLNDTRWSFWHLANCVENNFRDPRTEQFLENRRRILFSVGKDSTCSAA